MLTAINVIKGIRRSFLNMINIIEPSIDWFAGNGAIPFLLPGFFDKARLSPGCSKHPRNLRFCVG
jgi:hypothetical protein